MSPVDDDDWSSESDWRRIHALAVEVVALLRQRRASWMSQPALVLLAAEVVTTLFADLAPRKDMALCLSCVIESLCANIDGEFEREHLGEAGEPEGPPWC